MRIYRNCKLFLGKSGFVACDVSLGERGLEVLPRRGEGGEDLGGALVFPGLFDMHVHGGGGYTFASDDPGQVLRAYSAQLASGTAFLLATYVCLPYRRLKRCLCALREAMAEEPGILGAYIEGPFINPEKSGGMRRDYIEGWSISEFMALVEEFGDVISMVVLAPEREEAREAFRVLDANGIKVALGHSLASYEEAMEFVEMGAFCFTHLFNAMGPFHHRDPGIVGAALTCDAYCEVIPEPSHLHPASIKVALRAKGDRVVFVSDGTPLSSSSKKEAVFGGCRVKKVGGACFREDGRLYGSAISLFEGLSWLVDGFSLNWERVIANNLSMLFHFTIRDWGDILKSEPVFCLEKGILRVLNG